MDGLSSCKHLIIVSNETRQSNPINEPTNAKQAEGTEIQNTPAVSSQIELVQTEESKWYEEHVGVIEVSLPVKIAILLLLTLFFVKSFNS